ncbi:MAG TPA: hypothetical protein VFZ75_11090 [Actinomycetota bacterium]|nr:hypothetical protein [Actinomycetota bacterium]
MNDVMHRLGTLLGGEGGFVIGRIALVVLILAIIVVAALVAFIVPN